VSLKLKVATKYGDPQILVDVMKSYPRIEDVKTKYCTLEGSELFGSIKHKLNVPPGIDCNSH
jgi:hypothetical protein